ncbi:MAG: bifunctional phosphoribosylaminoimidazolecarboxamide formyltransferase/IMP cyclohydrolase [Candidatus Omnitrophica bacterium]|nr:bifunctional phosphoribosylaminoimidazolecarboxamide formyltransferase/IMP cyclohydrolase [Candidatus Omnitrophota bacterium]
MLKIRRALISVWDKKGIINFAKKLDRFKVEIVSTGKTAAILRKNNIPVKDVSEITQFPEILSGRVKTLHPKIFGGILANKKHPLHMEEINELTIKPFDLVAVNLYPFGAKRKQKLSHDEMIEYIDIGGHSLLRAAAKNHKNVACICNPSQYAGFLKEFELNKGFVSEEKTLELAKKAFYFAKQYDTDIFSYFCKNKSESYDLLKVQNLRYGENPHQNAELYKKIDNGEVSYVQLQGKELSYNNFLDLDAALRCLLEFNGPAAVVVKHSSPCGVGIDKNISKAFKKANAVDELSAFGGIIALNKKVDKETAKLIIKSGFKECIIAPDYAKESLKLFAEKKNLRVLTIDFTSLKQNDREVKVTFFGCLVQDRDKMKADKVKLKIVTKRKPTERELKDLSFAWKVAKHIRSNAITVAKNGVLLGIGGGQPSRVGAAKIAVSNAGIASKGAVMASDAFFPKDDSIKAAHKKGIRAIIQPGGSIKDEEVIKACDKYNIAMVFTGVRHFKH